MTAHCDLKTAKGAGAYEKGRLAEVLVVRHYCNAGYVELAMRYKTTHGEIDLIVEKDGVVVFVEVKASRDFERAVYRVTPRQQARIEATALQYLAGCALGLNTPCRFDVACVDDRAGIKIVQNAFM